MPELACYGLAGHTDQPADLLDEVRLAEELGLGSVFLSERFNLKDAGVLDFAGGTVVHVNAGVASLAAALAPTEVEQMDLWMSPSANAVRHDLYGMNASEEEFQSVYQLRKAFDQKWALTLVERVFHILEDEFARKDKPALFRRLRDHLTGDIEAVPYAVLATEFQMTEGALRKAVHDLRHCFGALLREEVAETVATSAEIDDELRHIMRAWMKAGSPRSKSPTTGIGRRQCFLPPRSSRARRRWR
jgi:hypothetical protein